MPSQDILLIEDNDDDIELTLRAFEKLNLRNPVIVARDGIQALDYLFGTGDYAGRSAALPALILLDLKLPKIDGFEVLRRIRAEPATRYIPITVLTTSSEAKDRLEGYRLGANSYVRKPMNFDHFMDAVRQVGAYWLTLNLSAPAQPEPQQQATLRNH